ncbi:hypothetical protein OQA88_2490 [Cercophora sp. LCS_1]
MAASNRNGFASSILAWLGGSTQQTGTRNFEGYTLYTPNSFRYSSLSTACQTALQAMIKCDSLTRAWTSSSYHGDLGNDTITDSVCDPGCTNGRFDDGSPYAINGNYIWYGVNETCQKDVSGDYCNNVISAFPTSQGVASMTTLQLCSSCYLGRLKMMQATRYSAYASMPFFQEILERAAVECGSVTATTTQPPRPVFCVSGNHHTVVAGDTCDSIALAHNVSCTSKEMFSITPPVPKPS